MQERQDLDLNLTAVEEKSRYDLPIGLVMMERRRGEDQSYLSTWSTLQLMVLATSGNRRWETRLLSTRQSPTLAPANQSIGALSDT